MCPSRRVASELRKSGVDKFMQSGLGSSLSRRPPFQTAVDDPYESYEANILWDEDEGIGDGPPAGEGSDLLADTGSHDSSTG